MTSYVYLIRAQRSGLIKIGTARDPFYRLNALQIGNAEILELVAVMPGGAAEEANLHKQFADYRIRSEWFEPAAEIVSLMNHLAVINPIDQIKISQPEPVFDELSHAWLRGLVQEISLDAIPEQHLVSPLALVLYADSQMAACNDAAETALKRARGWVAIYKAAKKYVAPGMLAAAGEKS